MVRIILNAACVAAVLGCVLAQSPVQATEPPCIVCEQGTPILSKLPYINRLVKNVGIAAAPAQHDNIQIVWEWEAAAACPAGACEVFAGPSECCAANVCIAQACGAQACKMKVCEANACRAAGCRAKCCDTAKVCAPHCVVISSPAESERVGVDFDFVCEGNTCTLDQDGPEARVCPQTVSTSSNRDSRLIGLYSSFVEQLNMVHEESLQREMELVEAIVEARVENAVLTAKLEAVEQHAQLAIENALLKAKLEQLEERLAKFESDEHHIADKSPVKRKR